MPLDLYSVSKEHRERRERKSSLLYKSVVERQITGDSADASAASATLEGFSVLEVLQLAASPDT